MENEVKKKSNKKYIIPIVILTILVIILGTYIIYDKVIVNDDKTNTTNKIDNKEEDNIVNITENDIKIFSSKIDDYNAYLTDYYSINDINDLNNDIILSFASRKAERKEYNSSFTKEEMDNIIKEYFGSDYNYTLKDINCFLGDGILYKYDNTTKTYNFYGEHPHGGEGFYKSKYTFIDGTYNKDTNEYTINTKVLYAPYAGDTYSDIPYAYYLTGSDSKNATNPVYPIYGVDGEDNSATAVFERTIEYYKESLPTTTYTFKKDENNNYGLKSVVIK